MRKRRKSNPQVRRPMTACERGAWIDTEGHIHVPRGAIEVNQLEREPLEDYCAGAIKDGIPCKVYWAKEAYVHRAEITAYENVAKEIVLTQHCIRTRKRHAQIEALKKHLLKPRKRLDPRVTRARKILGI